MATEIRNVTLSFPCGENWEEFQVVPGGRLCGSCKHIVRDFQHTSLEELKELLKSGQFVCGRFHRSQLSPTFLRAAAAVALATASACTESTPLPVSEAPVPVQDPIELNLDTAELLTGIVFVPDSLNVTNPPDTAVLQQPAGHGQNGLR